jgi:hypothetical protein
MLVLASACGMALGHAGQTAVASGGGGVSSSTFVIGTGRGVLAVSTQDVKATISGNVVVTYHGDPASGCAAHGLCGYSGTTSWAPPRSVSLSIERTRTTHGVDISAALYDDSESLTSQPGGTTRANVEQSAIPGSTCADVATTGAELTIPVHAHSLHFTLARADPAIMQTRCAGPLSSDIADAMPERTVPLASARHGEMTVDLSGSRAFGGHGFAGSVTSTLVVHLGHPGHLQRLPLKASKPKHGERYRIVRVAYRGALSGAVVARVASSARDPQCGPLGSCGLRGTISLTSRTETGEAFEIAYGPATRPYRDFLAALGISKAGRSRGIDVAGGFTGHSNPVSVSSEIHQGSVSCHDTVAGGEVNILLTRFEANRTTAFIDFNGAAGRTRCPGPFLGQHRIPGTVSIAPGQLAHRVSVVPFNEPIPVRDDGYTGTVSPHLKLVLTRLSIHSEFEVEPSGAFASDRAG